MKLFIHLVFFLGTVSMICYAMQTKGGKPKTGHTTIMQSSSTTNGQKNEAGGQPEVQSDIRSSASLGNEENDLSENGANRNPEMVSNNDIQTSAADSINSVPKEKKKATEKKKKAKNDVESADRNSTTASPSTQEHKAQVCEKIDPQLEISNGSLKVHEENQAMLHNITSKTNQSDSMEVTKQEESFTPTSNVDFTQEPTTPTPPSCPRVWPDCLSVQSENTVTEISKALMTFTLNLFEKLSLRESMPNLVVAPISVALALSNLMLGAGGETKDDMLNKLYKDIKNIGCIHEALKNLTTHDSFISASNIFYKQGLPISKEFLEQSSRFYGAKGQELDHDNEKSLKKINSWVSTKTKKLIPTLLQKLPADLQMILVNVIYYQGKWLSKFDPSETKKENFHRPSLGPVKVPMMNGYKYPLQHFHDQYLKAQVARFPLSDNCSLLILLPQKGALEKMTSKLNQEVLNTVMTELENTIVKQTSVSLPHLKLDTNLQLNDALSNLGFRKLFEYPNLCALSSGPGLAVSDVHHRAVFDVKEEGVKAAAATSISVARTVSVFDVQRPFLFILVSDKSKVPILIGRVTDPSQ